MMDRQGHFADKLASDKLRMVHDAWNALRAGRIGPRRDEITPARLRSVLGYTFIVDVVDDGGDFRFRFAGDRIIQFMGRRFAGMLLSEAGEGIFFESMRQLFSDCTTALAPVTTGVRQANYPGKEFLEVEALVLPVSEDGVTVGALFGALDSWQLGTKSTGR
jgi:hypothetical protein